MGGGAAVHEPGTQLPLPALAPAQARPRLVTGHMHAHVQMRRCGAGKGGGGGRDALLEDDHELVEVDEGDPAVPHGRLLRALVVPVGLEGELWAGGERVVDDSGRLVWPEGVAHRRRLGVLPNEERVDPEPPAPDHTAEGLSHLTGAGCSGPLCRGGHMHVNVNVNVCR